MKILRLAVFSLFFVSHFANAQLYFPPNAGNDWDTLAPSSLGWCQDSINSLLQFLDDRDSKSFVVLKDGKMVIEAYFDSFTQDSNWYWASSGKSLASYLVGIAQEKGFLNIEDSVSHYLGQGWTAATPAQEGQIKVRHQISMTTGLDDNVANTECLEDTCLNFLTAPDTRWAYYNAPYRLVQDVVVAASGSFSLNQFTNQYLANPIGMGGFWFDYVRYGTARDMARFGLLALSNGVWAGDTILGDPVYKFDMTHTANQFNEAYGYCWWLNGTSTYMIPSLQFTFQGSLAPSAPSDMFCALGKNDQKIYVIPSTNMVVVRQGNDASTAPLAISAFDEELWAKISQLSCPTNTLDRVDNPVFFWPNPAKEILRLEGLERGIQAELWSFSSGSLVFDVVLEAGGGLLDVKGLPRGNYLLRLIDGQNVKSSRLILQ